MARSGGWGRRLPVGVEEGGGAGWRGMGWRGWLAWSGVAKVPYIMDVLTILNKRTKIELILGYGNHQELAKEVETTGQAKNSSGDGVDLPVTETAANLHNQVSVRHNGKNFGSYLDYADRDILHPIKPTVE